MNRSRCLTVAAVLLTLVLISSVSASSLTREQILKELGGLEVCLRTMCLPAGDASMSIGGAQALITKLGQNSNALDKWVIQRLNAVVILLKQKKLKEGLDELQKMIKELPAK
ncbi:MAG: hypothetical protein HY815_09735 [Candidatus Riflebacteria bacterium]|nr:hypothetical protein [Candidatus Riflebacteria bacterium]